MKPGDHPMFFRFPAPEGASRESTIRLDAEGRFFHEGEPVVHPGLAAAMHTWIRRHPDDGRFILSNGYDWTYFKVEDVPFQVARVDREGDRPWLTLDDGTREAWEPARSFVGEGGALYTDVKASAPGGPFRARFSRHAQAGLEPWLVEDGGRAAARIGGRVIALGGAPSDPA